MQAQTEQVSDFFNKIAGDYREKYGERDAFLNYFFHERLEEACRGFEFREKRILDVGAGTGNLYDHLLQIAPGVNYHATDIAENMLRQSNIPLENQHIGTLETIDLPQNSFDYVFVLGVTTYLDDKELSRSIENVHRLLTAGGVAVVTFTNSTSLDWKIRSAFKRLPVRGLSERSVISQEFRVYARSEDEIRKLVSDRFTVNEIRWLNHTTFPLNQLLKRPSVKLAKRIHSHNTTSRWIDRASSDFLAVMTKK